MQNIMQELFIVLGKKKREETNRGENSPILAEIEQAVRDILQTSLQV